MTDKYPVIPRYVYNGPDGGVGELQFADKPPLGIMPRELWNGQRLQALGDAIQRYTEHNLPVPQEWIDEYNELVGE